MPVAPSDARIQSRTQAALLQRLAFDAACALQDDLRKAKSCAQRLRIVHGIEKVTKSWQDSRAQVAQLRQEHGPSRRPVNGNGHHKRPALPEPGLPEPIRSVPVTPSPEPSLTQPVVVAPVEQSDSKTQA